jgi:hypothetical protein
VFFLSVQNSFIKNTPDTNFPVDACCEICENIGHGSDGQQTKADAPMTKECFLTVNAVSATGHAITGPFKAVRVPHWPKKTQWAVFGYRAGVSASILEPVTTIRFTTRKAANNFLSLCNSL